MADRSPSIQQVIRDGLEELGLSSSDRVLATLHALSELVAAWASRMNLTGHRDAEAVARRLILDAAALYGAVPSLPAGGRVADLGSGAGFPGLPFAVLAPGLEVLLVESRERRHHFQRHAIRELGLRNVRALRGRFEAIDPEPCDLVVAQAVAPPSELVVEMLRWAKPGGTLAIPTSDPPSSLPPGLAPVRSIAYQAPLGGSLRSLWIAEVQQEAS